MIITKETDLGTISVSNVIFIGIITQCIEDTKLEDCLWLSTDKGKIVDKGSLASSSETAMLIDVDYVDHTHIGLEFNIVAKFGVSIRRITALLSDRIRECIREDLCLETSVITMNIAGVRSRKVAQRSTKVVYEYGMD